MVGKGIRVRTDLGKMLPSVLKPISKIQKKDMFGLGYKPNRQKKNRREESKKDGKLLWERSREQINGVFSSKLHLSLNRVYQS